MFWYAISDNTQLIWMLSYVVPPWLNLTKGRKISCPFPRSALVAVWLYSWRYVFGHWNNINRNISSSNEHQAFCPSKKSDVSQWWNREQICARPATCPCINILHIFKLCLQNGGPMYGEDKTVTPLRRKKKNNFRKHQMKYYRSFLIY